MSRPGLLNTKERYGVIAQLLHWATAILILILLPLGKYMHELPLSTSEEIAHKVWFYSLHKTLGMTVLCIALIRIFWALISKHPEPIHPERKLETFAAATVHWILYIAILLVPLAGYMHHLASTGFAPLWGPFPDAVSFIPKSDDLSRYAGMMHFILSAMMAISILAHIGGALKHAVIDRDGTLSRMIPFRDVTLSGFVTFGREGYRAPYKGVGAAPRLMAVALFIAAFIVVGGYTLLTTGQEQNQDGEALAANEVPAATIVTPEAKPETQTMPEGMAKWTVDAANSNLGITISQLGSPVSGQFANWTADIAFDPDQLGQSQVTVKIDMNSLTIGTVTGQAKSSDFLDVSRFPDAIFYADQFEKTDTGYIARGTLALHGVMLDLDLPFTLNIEGNQATMFASVVINRMAYGIGAQGFADEGSVAFDVIIDVDVTATKQ